MSSRRPKHCDSPKRALMPAPALSWKFWTLVCISPPRNPPACKRSTPGIPRLPNSTGPLLRRSSSRCASMNRERGANCALLQSLRRRRSRHRFRSMATALRRELRNRALKSRARLQSKELPLEKFPALERTGCRHGFVRRVADVELSYDKAVVLADLDRIHRQARRALGLLDDAFATAQQIHGNEVAMIDSPLADDRCFEGCDGLITNQRNVCLGIYVADCCALYLLDRKQRAAALIHSGKKGTELGIVSKAIVQMR